MSEVEPEIIECRPTKWFYLRAFAMVGMFAVFLVLFLKDWKVGWPKKNEAYYTYRAFAEAKKAFQEHEEAGGGAATWEAFVKSRSIEFPEGEGVLPDGVDAEARWPELLADYEAYRKEFESGEKEGETKPPFWKEYSNERGWSSKEPVKSYTREKIAQQLYLGIGSGVLMLVALFFLVRTSRRSMKVDHEAYYSPSGERIPFERIQRIDKRKWETKGLAYLYTGEKGALTKHKVDGMVYGQFKAEDGAPAERLFERILAHFSGQLVDYVDEGEDEAGPGAGSAKEGADEEAERAGKEAAEEVAGKEGDKEPRE